MDLFDDLPPPSNGIAENPCDELPLAKDGGTSEMVGMNAVGGVEGAIQQQNEEDETNGIPPAKRKKEEGVANFVGVAVNYRAEVLLDRYFLVGCAGERRGEREAMQDSHQMKEEFTDSFTNLSSSITRMGYYGLFDGHAGARASQFAADKLHENIVTKFPKGEISNQDREIKKCLVEAFRKTDDEFLAKATAETPSWKDGSTAVVLFLINDTVYVANLGDSKAVLCQVNDKGEAAVKRLTKDHNPMLYEERIRIQKAGGMVRDGRVMGVIEVSRSIGDGRFKHCGVTCIPDVTKFEITDKDRFILMACDGLFKAFSTDAAVKRVYELLLDKNLPLPAHMKSECYRSKDDRAARHEAACNVLAEEAVRKFSADNVSVMLIDIRQNAAVPAN